MKMIGRTLSALIAIAVTATALYALVPTAVAAPPQPHNLYGLAAPGVGLGALITGWVDGVDYSNDTLTTTVGGAYDIDIYGNWYTNVSNPNTITVKEGADLNDTVMFVFGDMTATGTVFQQAVAWQTGNSDNLDIAPASIGNQPVLLKIDCMNLRPSDAGTQYVWVHNPTGGPVDMTGNYYVKKDGVGATAYTAWQLALSGPIAAGTSEYFSLGASPLNATGDDLELVWTNTPASAFGGNDVVVDRVEWNQTISGGTHYWEASNTIMTDADITAAGRVLERTPTPTTDTNTGADFTEAPESGCTRPGAILISIASPAGGEVWSGNSNHNVVFTITAGGNVNWWANYSTDGAVWTNFDTSAGSVAPATFTEPWTVPCIDNTTVRVRVEATQGASSGQATSNLFEIDCTRPVATPDPANAATGISTGYAASVGFGEPMKTSYSPVPADVVFVPAVTTAPSWSGNTLMAGNGPFSAGQTYDWYISCNIVDDSDPGNAVLGCGANLWQFDTSTNPAPTVVISAPAGGESWSGLSSHGLAWTMTDDTPDSGLTVYINYTSSAGNGVVTGPTTTIETLAWTTPCIDAINVVISVTVIDANFQSTTALSNAFEIDCTAPTAIPNPTHLQTGVAVNYAMSVTFSEPMKGSPAPVAGDVTISGGITPSGVVYGTTLRLDIGSHTAFATTTVYDWFISCNLVDDSDPGNDVAGCNANMWVFTTSTSSNQVPTADPVFVNNNNTSPAIDHIIPTGTATFSWTYADGNSDPQSDWAWYLNETTPPVTGPSNSGTGTGLSDAFTGTLTRGTSYELRVFVRDGTDWSSAATLLFTVNQLPTPPVLQLPTDGDTNAPSGLTTLDWADSIDPDGDAIVFYNWCVDTAATPRPSCGTGTSTAATSTDSVPTSGATQYWWVVFANDGWEDGLDSGVFTFTTATNGLPSIAITAPVAGNSWTGNTPHTISWTITDEDPSTVMVWANYTSSDGNGAITNGLGLQTFSWNTPTIDALNVIVTVDAVDAEGAKATPLASSATFEIDSTKPVIATTVPANAAPGYSLTAPIIITFSESMDTAATQGAVTIAPSPGGLTFTWSGSNTILSIGHPALLATTAYSVTVSNVAEDDSDTGNQMNPASFSFTSGDATNPTATITPPGTITVDTDATFACTCDDDSGSIANYTWEARQGTDVIATWYGPTFTVNFPNTGAYTVSVTIRDASGNTNTDVVTGSVGASQPVEPVLPWWLIILIIAIVAGLILFLLVAKKRKKPAEDDTVPPPPGAAAPPPPPPGGAPPPPPGTEAATHECPSCGTIVTAGDTECFMCGTKL